MLGRRLKNGFPKRPKYNFWLIILVIVGLLAVGGVVGLRVWYNNGLAPVSSSTKTQYFTVEKGAGLNEIANNLKEAGLIRSPKAFETYVRGTEQQSQLQAGTYTLSPSMSVKEIVDKMVRGYVTTNLLTILPGKTLAEIEKTFAVAGYSQSQIDTAFNPVTYNGNLALASLPAGASLEGYLYPDSYQQTTNTPATAIVQESLDEMAAHLTPDIINGFMANGLSTYQGITLASIVVQESGDPNQEPSIAQVFYNRLNQGTMLQSNVTANYASDLAGVPRSVSIESLYNTYLHTGLPPGPISNVTAAALRAVAHPENNNYMYFIAGDDGTIHYSQTEAEHEQAIQQYCHKLCAQ